MKTIVTDKLTLIYVQKLKRYNYLATAAALVIAVFSEIWMVLHVGGDKGNTLFADLMYSFTALIGGIWACQTGYRGRHGPIQVGSRHQLVWFLVGLGLFFTSIGGIYFAYLEWLGQENPLPSLADIGFTLFYLCVFIGVLLMPTALRFRLRMALDALITTLSLLGVSWFFLIGPLVLRQKDLDTPHKLCAFLVAISYPCWDMVLILAIALLIQRRTQPILHPSLYVFGAGIISIIWADSGYVYGSIFTQSYQSGTPYIDEFWFIGFLLIGLSALYQYTDLAGGSYSQRYSLQTGTRAEEIALKPKGTQGSTWKRLQSSLIYLPLIFMLGLMAYQELVFDDEIAHYLVLISALVFILVTIRYLLATHENEFLLIEQEQLYQEEREHELFARALANMATRLNAAVVEPAEVYQLICTEGASAIRADYALLYVPNDNGQLIPTSAYIGIPGAVFAVNDWPPLDPSTKEAQVLYLLRPELLDLRQKPGEMMEANAAITADASEPEEHDYHASALREKLAECSIQTAIVAPLVSSGDPVGLLIFARSIPPGVQDRSSFTTADLPQVQDFVEHAAVAFSNAQLYERLQTAHRQQQELDQLKDQFMITASHELRTPLTAVQGYLELLTEFHDLLPPGQGQEFLQKAQRSCDELVVLLNNVMDISRLEEDAGIRPVLAENVSLAEMVRSVIDLIQPQLTQEHRTVECSIPADLYVQADPLRLRQVLVNVSVNALKYSPPSTPITYSARTITAQRSRVIIRITDAGKGIAPEEQSRIFQRFYRLERDINSPIRGSGLGLYISRQLIEAMGGKIWVESSGIPGEGSTFHIQLPSAP
ncbi:MAG: ATP-binding protein, partial [Ktedonobacteraceae bacterium]